MSWLCKCDFLGRSNVRHLLMIYLLLWYVHFFAVKAFSWTVRIVSFLVLALVMIRGTLIISTRHRGSSEIFVEHFFPKGIGRLLFFTTIPQKTWKVVFVAYYSLKITLHNFSLFEGLHIFDEDFFILWKLTVKFLLIKDKENTKK